MKINHPNLLIILGLFILSSLSAKADGTHYQELQQLFDQAGPASLNDLDAAYAGRCFYNKAIANSGSGSIAGQNDAAGSILVGRRINPPVNPSQDGGPLFPPPAPPAPYYIAEVSTGALYQADGTHYRFDDWTEYQAQQMLDYSVGIGELLYPVNQLSGDIRWHEDYNRGTGPHVDNTLRRSGDYLVLHSIEVAQGHEANPQTDFYCYFYKQLN